MKKIYIAVLAAALLLLIGALSVPQDVGRHQPLSTAQEKAITVATVTADATARTATTMTWKDANSLFIPIEPQWNGVSLSFYGYGDGSGAGDPCDSTFSFDIYVCSLFSGFECVSSANTGAIGAQQLSHNPVTGVRILTTEAADVNTCWADTISEGADKWSKDILYSDAGGHDGLAKVKFDRHESYGIYVRMYNMTAQSVTSITCIANGY